MAGEDIFSALEDLPFRRYALAQLNRVDDLVDRLGVPLMTDQGPGKDEPMAFSCLYGPIPMQATRHTVTAGFSTLAPLVSPSTPYMPREANPLTGHDYAFRWLDTNVAALLQWSYAADPGIVVPVYGALSVPIIPMELGDIFDPVMSANGGAQVWQNFSQSFADQPRVCFEIDLYDKKRGRSITNGKVPAEVILGGTYDFKPTFGPMRWDPDTEIEPRVYITEVKMSSVLDTAQAYTAARVGVYLNILFRGTTSYVEHPTAAGF